MLNVTHIHVLLLLGQKYLLSKHRSGRNGDCLDPSLRGSRDLGRERNPGAFVQADMNQCSWTCRIMIRRWDWLFHCPVHLVWAPGPEDAGSLPSSALFPTYIYSSAFCLNSLVLPYSVWITTSQSDPCRILWCWLSPHTLGLPVLELELWPWARPLGLWFQSPSAWKVLTVEEWIQPHFLILSQAYFLGCLFT